MFLLDEDVLSGSPAGRGTPQNSSRTLSIKLDYNTLAKIDYISKCYKFSSRSDFIRKAIIYKINQIHSKYYSVDSTCHYFGSHAG